ncbi:CRISPR-associated endonuclease Cas3'' [Rhodobacter sp. SGA-6-6]|uniref:CRISPR-associated endonuclease Cas3'' n=1 Tax=Rhodobacter sp. SGA-6-6 TaxID=2710882 RepID=UPI0013ECC20F|nr:CRISPR-associated endonuclease Cas3'' [Rhodobacter sp. SGA-6-6]NGM47826.1 CRISPR-associated endonuclease Cas3'' [Rhodobacter sp. SGA-6-6]
MQPPQQNTYFAHSGKAEDGSDWQTLSEHLEATAARAATAGHLVGLPLCASTAARFHDFGKYDPAFQRRLSGDKTAVDHSTAGAHLLLGRAGPMPHAAQLLAYAILGHHAGLPDKTGSQAAMDPRIAGFRDPVPAAITAAQQPDLSPLLPELMAKMRISDESRRGFDASVAGRMIFSCLVDADYKDTEAFYDKLDGRSRDRDWPALSDILPDLRARFEAHMAGLPQGGDLNPLRRDILTHIRAGAALPPGLFTLTVPTGGGKTLASLGFALDHAAAYGHRRIIYAIPYTSIIDQTAQTFRSVFKDLGHVVLEHHSSIDEERPGQQGRDKARLAMEDWAAPLVVTTNVQLFESLFAARPSRARKLHNIAGSILILDEAQALPRELLMPVLRMLDTLATHYGCTIVLCTATQPAFDSAQLGPGGLPLAGRELAPDPQGLAKTLRRARIFDGGEMDDPALIEALRDIPQGMVIVNSRKHALELFRAAQAEGLDSLIHLTTRQYPAHRRRIIAGIRDRLDPENPRPCRLIATSLIEAGVDLDFPKGWRAEAGLDSIVQSAGRVNREGKRPVEDSTLTVFRAPDHPPHPQIRPLSEATRVTAAKFGHEKLLETEAINHWFNQVYWTRGIGRMGQPMVDAFTFAHSGTDFPYRSTAEAFRMIDSPMVPVIVAIEDKARSEVEKLAIPKIPSGGIARALQAYTVQVPEKARALLIANGHARFHATHLRGDQFCVLENRSLYRTEFGLHWEQADYLAADQSIV